MADLENQNVSTSVPAPSELKVICAAFTVTGDDTSPEECKDEAVAKWTIAVLGKILMEDFHLCEKHDDLCRRGAIAIKRDQLNKVSLATSGIITPGEVIKR